MYSGGLGLKTGCAYIVTKIVLGYRRTKTLNIKILILSYKPRSNKLL